MLSAPLSLSLKEYFSNYLHLFSLQKTMRSNTKLNQRQFQIGMPLFMMFLGGIGDTMADAMRYGYSRICCR